MKAIDYINLAVILTIFQFGLAILGLYTREFLTRREFFAFLIPLLGPLYLFGWENGLKKVYMRLKSNYCNLNEK